MPRGLPKRKIELVLIEYDGPQLVIIRDAEKQRYVGLSADSEGALERWIHVPITDMELEGLCTGGVTMRNVLAKPRVEIADYNRGRLANLSGAKLDRVPSGVLPLAGAYLPERIGEAALLALRLRRRRASEPAFRCGGAAVGAHTIAFACLARRSR